MKKVYYSLAFVLLVWGGFSPLVAGETTGWYAQSNSQRLYIDGILVYDSSDEEKIELPSQLSSSQEIEAYLYLAEFFLKKKSRQGVATILYKIRLKPSEFKLADALITTLWKKSSQEDSAAQKTLDSYIRSEKDSYYKGLAKNIYASLFASGEDEKKSPERLNCNARLPYYSFCRLFRLQYYLDRTQGSGESLEDHYSNILRVVSPFYEEKSLHAIPFLEELDEDLPPRLAFLGLANESLNFQRIILEAERAAYGGYTDNSLERVSFFQILSGNWEDAAMSLKDLAIGSRNKKKKSYRNRILIKLGTAYYLSGKYDDALKYYLEIDFSEWSSLITHPLTNEPLSIPEAKDLISLAVWKTKGREAAVTALREIPKGDKVYQEEVWPRLRIAQLIMDSNPELSARIIDEISYLAQSRGWKRLEYTATLLQGHNRILEGEQRKATIELTKARGILGKEEAQYANEWLRNTGMYFAHSASDKKAPVSTFLQASLKELHSGYPDEEYLSILYYKAQAFDWKRFVKTSVEYSHGTSDSRSLLDSLLFFENRNRMREPIYNTGLFQIILVQERMQKFSGFQTHRDANLLDSTYSQSRESLAKYLLGKKNIWNSNFDKSVKNPFIAIFPFEDKLFFITFDPKQSGSKRWNHFPVPGNNPSSGYAKGKASEFIESLSSPELVQIYHNETGLSFYESIRKAYKDQAFSLFFRFHANPDYSKDRNLALIMWKDKTPSSDILSATSQEWEGTSTMKMPNRLHIWDYSNQYPRSLLKMEWKGDHSKTVSLKRIVRRLDSRTVPMSLFTSGENLGIGFSMDTGKWLDWSNFWFEAGTEMMYYRKTIPWKEIASQYKSMPVGIKWNQDSEVISVSRDLY